MIIDKNTILKWILKDYVTLKTRVMASDQLCHHRNKMHFIYFIAMNIILTIHCFTAFFIKQIQPESIIDSHQKTHTDPTFLIKWSPSVSNHIIFMINVWCTILFKLKYTYIIQVIVASIKTKKTPYVLFFIMVHHLYRCTLIAHTCYLHVCKIISICYHTQSLLRLTLTFTANP